MRNRRIKKGILGSLKKENIFSVTSSSSASPRSLLLALTFGMLLGFGWGAFIDRDMDAAMAGQEAGAWNQTRASWYGPGFQGHRTANGERYDMMGLTAAHRRLPFNTWIEVCRKDDPEKCVIVRINDRGPFVRGRDLDLSKGAALKLDMIREGVIRVAWRIAPAPEPGR